MYNAGFHIVVTAYSTISLLYLPDGPSMLKLCLDVMSSILIKIALAAPVSYFG
jgi:hypothetical protein